MTMVSQEIDSFVKKFRQLWSAGFCAHLDLDSNAGEAWVGLRVNLGHSQVQHDILASSGPKFETSSRQRRRARRSAARESRINVNKEAAVEVEEKVKDEVNKEATVEVEEKEKVKDEVNENKTTEVFTDVDKTENLTINKLGLSCTKLSTA